MSIILYVHIWAYAPNMIDFSDQILKKYIFKGLTQNSTPKLKVESQLYVHSENFMKKYLNPIEFYYFERSPLFEYCELR